MSFEDVLLTTRAARENISSLNQRFAPLAHFAHDRHQHMSEEYDFEEYISSLKSLAERVNISAGPAASSAGRLLVTLNSVDTDIFPRVCEMNASAT